MKRTLIHNATIVNEGQSVKGSVVIEDGRIAEVLTNWKPLSAPCDETIDATGCYLLPGIIDDHVHFRDPGTDPQSGHPHRKPCGCRRWCDLHHGYAQYKSGDHYAGCA